MGTARTSAAPPPRWYDRETSAHVVQFYHDETPFLNELSRFIGTALVAGEAAMVVATKAHRDLLAVQLKERGLDLSRAARQGRYLPLDAADTLSKIVVNGQPDGAHFNALMGSMITGLAGASGDHRRVGIFGEMVTLLWAEGKANATLQLEQLWNDLARTHTFSLRCAYPTNGFGRLEESEAFLKICDAHSGVIPDDSYTKLSGDQERLRKIAELQQAAQTTTALAKANENLRQSEERFRLRVENVKDYAIFMLSPEGHILSWNVGAQRIKGYYPEEIIGQHFSKFYTPKDVQSGKPERALRIAAAEGRFEDEGWRVRKDGTQFWANVVVTALFDAAGSLRGFSKVTRDITERKEAEEALRELSGRLLRAQEEERRRLGRELHDSTAQTLTAISINLALLNQQAEVSTSPKASAILAELTELANQAAREIRNIAYLLHAPMLEQTGLGGALRLYVDGYAKRTQIRVELETDPRLDRLSKELEMALFRVVQESLTNVYRHSGSSTAKVRLALESAGITLEVSDEGKGFPMDAVSGRKRVTPATLGVGITGMRERIRQLGGRLEVKPGKVGISVRAVVPFASPEEPEDSAAANREALVTPEPADLVNS